MATTKKVKSGTSEPQTMDELLASYGQRVGGYKRGETVKGKVVEAKKGTVYIDIGGKAEAIVSEQEYALNKEYFKSLKTGDEVAGVVLVTENDAGQVVLSLRRAAMESKWKTLEMALAEETPIYVKVKSNTKGGVLVEAEGIYGFIPSSQFGKFLEGGVSAVAGQALTVKVIELDRAQNRLVLSEKAVSDAAEIEKRRKMLDMVRMGKEYDGVVVGTVPFGAFVEILVKEKTEEKLEGLVHVSEISWEKVEDVSKFMKEGDLVKVQVIGIDEDTGKLALSIKRLVSDPWLIVAKKYSVDSKHKGIVTKIMPYGVLVRMEKGIEGLIHASKLPVDRVFREGDEVEVFVESVDLDKRRLSLGVVIMATKEVIYK